MIPKIEVPKVEVSKVEGIDVSTQHERQSVVEIVEQRLQVEYLLNPKEPSSIDLDSGKDVIVGLSQSSKSLPPRYFYDDRGSQLFEQICDLPEYYLTRTETAILRECAKAIVQITGPCELVELGSGSAVKTRLLLDAYAAFQYPLHYLPIDISAGILESSARDLLSDYPSLKIHGRVSTYELALSQLTPAVLPSRLICFLGSSLGNLTVQECDTFFTQIGAALQVGEYFLLGIDLQKPLDLLEAAYNDSQGVTAEFNLNMLRHLNWRFQGNFRVDQFAHLAFYNSRLHQVEIYLKSLKAQSVHLQALNLDVELEQDEMILSEISRKFELQTLKTVLQSKGLIPLQTWTDSNNWFGVLLCQRQEN